MLCIPPRVQVSSSHSYSRARSLTARAAGLAAIAGLLVLTFGSAASAAAPEPEPAQASISAPIPTPTEALPVTYPRLSGGFHVGVSGGPYDGQFVFGGLVGVRLGARFSRVFALYGDLTGQVLTSGGQSAADVPEGAAVTRSTPPIVFAVPTGSVLFALRPHRALELDLGPTVGFEVPRSSSSGGLYARVGGTFRLALALRPSQVPDEAHLHYAPAVRVSALASDAGPLVTVSLELLGFHWY
jgi:hypothetical protein